MHGLWPGWPQLTGGYSVQVQLMSPPSEYQSKPIASSGTRSSDNHCQMPRRVHPIETGMQTALGVTEWMPFITLVMVAAQPVMQLAL